MRTIIITGVAGFIGHATALELLSKGNNIIGIDSMIGDGEILSIKERRLSNLLINSNFKFLKKNILDSSWKEEIEAINCDLIIHLAAFAGVRKSMQYPLDCLQTNVLGFTSVLDFARSKGIKTVIYASSSSVYGEVELSTQSNEDTITKRPTSIYAASKAADELIANVYSHTYGIQTIGLRFFSVFGPYGRPDMAPWIFADSFISDKEAAIFGNGEMMRDFTYIDDVISAIDIIVENDIHSVCEIYNIGSSNPHSVWELYNAIQVNMGISGKFHIQERQSGDVLNTYADMTKFHNDFGLLHHTDFSEGIKQFCQWFKEYKGIQ